MAELVLLNEAQEFVYGLPKGAQNKILYNVNRILKGELNNKLFKKLEDSDDIWEIRALFNGIQYRLFSFWDTEEDMLVVATHGIIKKTEKTPRKEIKKPNGSRKNTLKKRNVKNISSMEKMGRFEIYTLEEVMNDLIGEKGSAERKTFDKKVDQALRAYHAREAKKKKRQLLLVQEAQTVTNKRRKNISLTHKHIATPPLHVNHVRSQRNHRQPAE